MPSSNDDGKKGYVSIAAIGSPGSSMSTFVLHCPRRLSQGSVLLHKDHPIAYFSKGFSSNRFRSAYDRELLALLLGSKFVVHTDHPNLRFLLDQRVTTNDHKRLLLKLLPFKMTIEYKPGKETSGVEALSRRPLQAEFLALTLPVTKQFSGWE
ncbi:hypothetical protein V2J09_013293 [Rumex salicifolius]